MMRRRNTTRIERREPIRFRDIGEAEAFRRETHAGDAHVLQGTTVGAHTVVMSEPFTDMKWKGAPGWSRGPIRHVAVPHLDPVWQRSREKLAAPNLSRCAEHGRLLLGLAAAAIGGVLSVSPAPRKRGGRQGCRCRRKSCWSISASTLARKSASSTG